MLAADIAWPGSKRGDLPGGLVLDACGRQSLFLVSKEGFVETELELETPVVDLG